MADVEEEIKELRRFRHDLEGRGIMSLPERVVDLEKSAQREALDNLRMETAIDALKEGFIQLRVAIEGFHKDVSTVRSEVTVALQKTQRWVVIGIVTLSLSALLPEPVMNSVIAAIVKLF
jgi:lipoate-protein ligase A